MPDQPRWWNEEHDSAWERLKSALKRDWEQTKHDLGGGRHGTDLDQEVGDTVKQAAGRQPIPPDNMRTPRERRATDTGWDRVEPDHRYGVGARRQYGRDDEWNDEIEAKLRQEWQELGSGRPWDEVKATVRRGWERAKK